MRDTQMTPPLSSRRSTFSPRTTFLHPSSPVSSPPRRSTISCDQLVGARLHLEPILEEKNVEVTHRVVREEWIEVPRVEERVIEVIEESIQYVDRPVYRTKEVEKIIEVPVTKCLTKIVEVPEVKIKKVYHDKITVVYEDKYKEVEKVIVQDKIVEIPRVIRKEKIVEVPKIAYEEVLVEKVIEVPQVEYKYKYRTVAIPHIHYEEVPVEIRKPQFYDQKIVKTIDVPVRKVWERFTYKPVSRRTIGPMHRLKERLVYQDIPVDTYRLYPKMVPIFKKAPKPSSIVVPKKIIEVEADEVPPIQRIVRVPKRVVRKVQKIVDVPIQVPREPEVETEEGRFIPLSEWQLLRVARIEMADAARSHSSDEDENRKAPFDRSPASLQGKS